MRKISEILRLSQESKLSNGKIAGSLGISKSTVAAYLTLAKNADVVWPLAEGQQELLEKQLSCGNPPLSRRPLPEMATVHLELKKPGVTLQLLWEEYRGIHPDAYHYTQFCHYYREWEKRLGVTMRQNHVAGQKMFVDYSGDKFHVVDSTSGEVQEAELFVAVLGASSYTHAEATWTQTLPDWIASHIHAFEYFEGVSQIVVPDNLKSGVTKTCRYEPDINPTYHDLCLHYGCAVIPARPYKPRDKAKVECGVLFAQRWILAVLRHQTFFSLAELNQAIREALDKLNNRPMQKIGKSRREMYLEIEKAALKPLPQDRYVLAEFKNCRVNIDYHIEVDSHYYSVPYTLVGDVVEARYNQTTIEVFYKGRRVASHLRSSIPYKPTTVTEHMPRSHQKHAEWTPSRLNHWGKTVGEEVGLLFDEIMKARPHPEQGFRSCLGIMRLAKVHGNDRLKKACERALSLRSHSYRTVKNILTHKLEATTSEVKAKTPDILHDHLRGASYYQSSDESASVNDPQSTILSGDKGKEGHYDARGNNHQAESDETFCDGKIVD